MSAKALEAAEKEGLLEYFKLTTKLTTSNMICFDLNGKIKRYDSPEHILEDFYPARLAFYQKRKASVLLNPLLYSLSLAILTFFSSLGSHG
jgi:DNA topoisomerase II